MQDPVLSKLLVDAACEALQIDKPGSVCIAERFNEVLLRIDQVTSLTGISRASIYREIKAGRFPKPLKATDHISVWKLTEIERWMNGLDRAA